jgi:ubiquinone/menaquinone biosynthesis C-methylase UbiE
MTEENVTEKMQDIWSRWLLEGRYAGDQERMQPILENFLFPLRDRVLSNVNLPDNGLLLDVGCGDGLIGFGALEQYDHCSVIFSDISQDLLDQAQTIAKEMDLLHRCQFLKASATDLSALSDVSVDAVTTRSVLIYVADKKKAFTEFHRLLNSGGRLSIYEPINSFTYPEPLHIFKGYDVMPVREIAEKIMTVYIHIQAPNTDPMLNFDERDLVEAAEEAGFKEVHLELQIDIHPFSANRNWDVILHTAGNPKIPTLEEAMQQSLTPQEVKDFTAHLRPLVEAGRGIRRLAQAYLWATK